MKKIWILPSLSLALGASACGGRTRTADNPSHEEAGTAARPKVYMTRSITPEALTRICEAIGREAAIGLGDPNYELIDLDDQPRNGR
ncbi:hypothetical protein [Alistipes shahii]